VLERIYPLSETPEAIRRVETAHVRGKLAISVPTHGRRVRAIGCHRGPPL
jgi:hypothetical protein